MLVCGWIENAGLGELTVLEHLHDVLLDHREHDLATQATGDPIQGAFTSYRIAVDERVEIMGAQARACL